MSTEGVDAATVVSAVLDGPDPGPGKPSASGLVTSAMYARSTGRGQPIPEEEWAGCWDRSIIAALLAVNPGGSVLLSPDGRLSAWEPPALTDEERALRDSLRQRADYGYEEGYAEVYVVTEDLRDAVELVDRLAPPPVQQEEDGQ